MAASLGRRSRRWALITRYATSDFRLHLHAPPPVPTNERVHAAGLHTASIGSSRRCTERANPGL
ncbi:hypothetical protein XMIN_616 [Xanthomonas citri pv. mangiferaeindicae LMG 941]|nr:hypothetical protein XMIN_616 [Xanthomonas citri pv. mangiferaeindicae LMG 941]